ncbi:hypothetical protein PENSPDRAFT_722597 [Peniophora sp. CONT]|nr:hypothetical protein PENSPDRAFT_722597 [Peniophora sp. CONT]
MISNIFLHSVVVVALAISVVVRAETHTITFTNNCGFGTPTLRDQNGNVVSTGASYTVNGRLIGAIAYLQTGACGSLGEGCTLSMIVLTGSVTVETSLINTIGSGTDISLIPPHTFNVASGFNYFGGCDSVGRDCADPNCPAAAHSADDAFLQTEWHCCRSRRNYAFTSRPLLDLAVDAQVTPPRFLIAGDTGAGRDVRHRRSALARVVSSSHVPAHTEVRAQL